MHPSDAMQYLPLTRLRRVVACRLTRSSRVVLCSAAICYLNYVPNSMLYLIILWSYVQILRVYFMVQSINLRLHDL